jgi:hypothetical protein
MHINSLKIYIIWNRILPKINETATSRPQEIYPGSDQDFHMPKLDILVYGASITLSYQQQSVTAPGEKRTLEISS